MLNKEVKHIDISNTPELVRLVEEVQRSNQVTVLTKDGEEVLEVRPAKTSKKKRVKKGVLTKDDPMWNIVGMLKDDGGPTDVSTNVDKYLAEAYSDTH